MMIAVAPFVVSIVGVLGYALASNAKVSEIGRIAYAVGLFWLIAILAKTVWHLG